MKKLMLIVFMFVALNSYAVQVYQKGIGGYVEFGQSLEPVETYYAESKNKKEELRSEYIAFTDINLHYVFQFWNIQFIPFTSIKTWAIPKANQFKGHPFADVYTSGAEILWENISITVDHYCAHAVYSNQDMWRAKDYRMGQNMTEIKIKYSFN